MYIELDITICHYDDDLVDAIFYRHKGKYVTGIATLNGIPKYQALAMQNALKAADPEDYPKCTLTVLSSAFEARRYGGGGGKASYD